MTDGLSASQGQVSYSYDNANRLTSRTRTPAGGTATGFSYGYDGFGRLAARVYPDGTTTAYTLNDNDQVTQQAWAASTTPGAPGDPRGTGSVAVTYGYDPVGNLTAQNTPNNVTVTDTYDAADRLVTTLAKRGTATVSKFDQTLDRAGNPTVITTRRGTAVSKASYTYDQDNRLTQVCYASPCLTGSSPSPSISYGYDANDNRTSEKRVGVASPGTRVSVFNDLDQLTQISDASGNVLATYGYDVDGHQTSTIVNSAGSAAGLGVPNGGGSLVAGSSAANYNLADQLVSFSATPSGGTAQTAAYSYDGNGNRATKSANNVASANYQWDVNGPLPQLALELGSNANLQRRYEYGAGGVLAQATSSTSSADLWLLQDLQGNSTDVLDSAGQSAWSGTYEAFGAVMSTTTASTGAGAAAASSPTRFDSQYFDTSIGLYNNRARQYDSSSGRFTSYDAVAPDEHEGLASPYGYVNARPTVMDDPSGNCPMCISALIGAAIGATVGAGIYLYNHHDAGSFSAAGLAASAGTGAVAGGVIGLTGGIGVAAGASIAADLGLGTLGTVAAETGASAITSAAGHQILNSYYGQPYTGQDLVSDLELGVASGALGSGVSSLRATGSCLRTTTSVADSAGTVSKLLQSTHVEGKTAGVLDIDGHLTPLLSGPSPLTNCVSSGHVEGQAAAIMRQTGAKQATLYIDNPNGICNYCRTQLATLLPEGATLDVRTVSGTVPPTRFWGNSRIFTGNSNDPKPPRDR